MYAKYKYQWGSLAHFLLHMSYIILCFCRGFLYGCIKFFFTVFSIAIVPSMYSMYLAERTLLWLFRGCFYFHGYAHYFFLWYSCFCAWQHWRFFSFVFSSLIWIDRQEPGLLLSHRKPLFFKYFFYKFLLAANFHVL